MAFGLVVTPVTPASAQTPSSSSVVELFTSQSCSSCPPAEAYLGRLAGRADVIALEFHVDYWNDLTYGLAGKWKDVHSSPAFTARQRAYAERLPGGVYTPQMIIDGRAQAIGSREAEVEAALRDTRRVPRLQLSLTASDAGKTELWIKGAGPSPRQAADTWLVRFKLREETKVRAGENRGKTLVNHHVVTDMTRLEPRVSDRGSIILDGVSHGPDEGCAVLIQGVGHGPILGAALCPAVSGKAS